jgi:hypothetical protein
VSIEKTSSSVFPASSGQRRAGQLRDWLMVAWALWWGWAYVQSAVIHRFPHLLAWCRWRG